MATFDENKYKSLFEQRYGKGSFDSGLSDARKIGQLKAQAEIAKKQYSDRKKASKNKSYNDALGAFGKTASNDEAEKQLDEIVKNPKKEGAYRNEEKIRNNPALQEAIKSRGWTQKEFIDAMYNVASGGQFKSERDFNSFDTQLKKDTNTANKKRDKEYKEKYDMTFQEKYEFDQKMKKANANKDNRTGLEKLKTSLSGKDTDGNGERNGVLGFLDRTLGRASRAAHKTVFGEDFVKKQDEAYSKVRENSKNKEALTQMQKTISRKPQGALEKGSDIAGSVIAEVGPYAVGYGVADKSLKVAKGLSALKNPIAREFARGGIAGAAVGTGKAAIRDASSDEYGAKDYAKQIGTEALVGGASDAALSAIFKIIKGARVATKQATKQPGEVLGLPAPSQALALPEPQPKLNAPLSHRMEGINFAQNTKNVPKARINSIQAKPLIDPLNRGQQYWQGRYESFAKHINDKYDMNKMTPEALDDLWGQYAGYDEPVRLEQAVDLAYPQGFDSTPKIEFAPKQPEAPLQPLQFRRLAGGMERQFIHNNNTNIPKGWSKQDIKNSPVMGGEPSLERLKNLKPGKDFETITSKAPKNEGGTLTRVEDASQVEPLNLDELRNIKDIHSPQVGTKDLYRLADRLPERQKTAIQSSLDTAKKGFVDMQERLTNDVYEKVVKGLGIKKGSKESALVQDFGEKTIVKRYLRKRGIDPKKLSNEELGRINLQQLQKTYPKDWERIVQADQYFRENYNNLIDEVNRVRSVIYPNNPDKIVPKRTDYYHHFNELEGLEGLKNLFDTPANIDPTLEGISPFTKPKAKFQSFMQKRGNGKYTSDALGGFLKYLKASSYSINVDPVIPVVRQTANDLASATADTRNANKIIEALNMQANDLAGKTNPVDRVPQMMLGRKGMNILNWANSRVKSNMILGNLGSALGQLGNVPLGVGKAKQHAVTGLKDTLEQSVNELVKGDKSAPIHQSQFIKERYSDALYRRFDQKLIEQPRRLASWMMETSEKAGTNFVWNSMYNKGLKEGATDPIKYADYETRNIIAGRGVGEVPLFQKSKSVQILAPFTLEVGNQWRVLKDMVGEKDAAGILTFLIASYGLNRAVEEVRGSGVSFDPIDALIDGYTQGEGDSVDKGLNALASLNGEVVGNIPGGNLLTQFAGTDKKVPGTDMQYKELFGERDPNRFGTGLTLSKIGQDPLYATLPFGASQIRKTTRGMDATINEGVYKGDNDFVPFNGDRAELNYPIETTPLKNLQMLLFGPSATSDAKEYYNNDRRPLSEKQTTQYENMRSLGQGDLFYNNLTRQRQMKTIQDQMKDVYKNQELSQEEKSRELIRLMSELQKLQQR